MRGLLNIVLAMVLAITTMTVYGQKKKRNVKQYDSVEVYRGNDVIQDLVKAGRDTVFTRHYLSSFLVDSTRLWREEVTYTGEKLDDNKYKLSAQSMLKEKNVEELKLNTESEKIYHKNKSDATYILNRRYLLEGLVEEVVHQNKKYTAKCIDKDGNVLNETGCLRYSQTPFPVEKTEKFQRNLQKTITNLITNSRGKLPRYIILAIEADYESQRWNLALDFPKEYKLGSDMHTSLVAAIAHVLNNEKLEEYHFEKDINGNYYNRTMFIPLIFKR
ncbi:hypothetical protein [Myroides odoratimimus]|uniref:hypothetical protein n=1 Tax=Myroides odoratimimus TaxID=76832 RepID=UPI003100FB50